MKPFILILLLWLVFPPAEAQNTKTNKIFFATTVGTGFSLNEPPSTPFTWQVLGYYRLSGRWFAGIGTGLSSYEKMLLPLYGNIRFQIGKERRFTPYAEFATGYSFALSAHANGGFCLNPSVGIQYRLKHKLKLQLAVGYEIQKLERLKTQTDNYFHKEFAEKLNHRMIPLRIGVFF